MFYKFFNINGTVFPIAVNISGHGAPTASTEGAVDMLYRNVDDNSVYQCTAASNGIYIWEPFSVFNKDNITLGLHTDGLIYIFIDGTPVGNGIALPGGGQSGDVIGNVDSGNNIVLNGDLADGTYTVKYEMEDGSTIDIGELVLDTNVYYSVISNLTKCTNGNNATSAVKGGSYNATITANSGYELSSVVVTMGGTDISSTAVSGGSISIANVTGNIVITAVAEEPTVEIINQIPISTDENGNIFNGVGYQTGFRMSISSMSPVEKAGYEITGFIPAKYGDIVRIKNLTIPETSNDTYTNITFFNSDKQPMASSGSGQALGYLHSTDGATFESGIATFALNAKFLNALTANAGLAYFRLSGADITDETILTINQEIV